MHRSISISILGCGWLGFPLALSLKNNGYLVKGSTTSAEKLPALSEKGIEPFLVQFSGDHIPGSLSGFLKSDVLIITVPPGRDIVKHQNYFGMLNSLTEIIPESSIRKVIFISSTSVYGDMNKTVNEWDEPEPDTAAGRRMLRAEHLVSQLPVEHVIVRLSGLIGPDRHPGRFLSGKTDVANGLAPVNLIHLDDAAGIITEIVNEKHSHGVYIASAPDHPSKQDFYVLASRRSGLVPPTFIAEKTSWKQVESARIKQELNYRFKVTDLMQWAGTN